MQFIDKDNVGHSVDKHIKEAKRVGKVPWSASDYIESMAYARLNPGPTEEYPQESFWDSYDRWLKEGKITQAKYDEAVEQDKKWKKDALFSTALKRMQDFAAQGYFSEFFNEYFVVKILDKDNVQIALKERWHGYPQ